MPVINRTQFTKALQDGQLHGAYIFEGTEESLKQAALREVEKRLLPPGFEDLNVSRLEGPSEDDIITACETMPLMADQRLVIVRDLHIAAPKGKASTKKQDFSPLLQYLPQMAETCVLIIITDGKLAATTTLYKTISTVGTIVSFNPMTEQELSTWIIQQFKQYDKLCSRPTASLLTFTSGTDTTLLQQEIAKLAAHCGSRDGVTDEDIREMATPSVESRIFDLTDAVVNGRQQRALSVLRDLERNGEQRVGILAMLLRQYRILQQIKIMQYEHVSVHEMPALLDVKEFALQKYLEQARRVGTAEAKEGVRICMDYEYRIKSGQISDVGAPESCLLELFLLKSNKT